MGEGRSGNGKGKWRSRLGSDGRGRVANEGDGSWMKARSDSGYNITSINWTDTIV